MVVFLFIVVGNDFLEIIKTINLLKIQNHEPLHEIQMRDFEYG